MLKMSKSPNQIKKKSKPISWLRLDCVIPCCSLQFVPNIIIFFFFIQKLPEVSRDLMSETQSCNNATLRQRSNGSCKSYYDNLPRTRAHIWSANQKIKDADVGIISGSDRQAGGGELERKKKLQLLNLFLLQTERTAREVFTCTGLLGLFCTTVTRHREFLRLKVKQVKHKWSPKNRCDLLPLCRFTVIRFWGAASSWFFEQSKIIFYSCRPSTTKPPHLLDTALRISPAAALCFGPLCVHPGGSVHSQNQTQAGKGQNYHKCTLATVFKSPPKATGTF